jgi:hypothetical protein
MPKQDDDEQDAGVILPRRQSMRAKKAYLLALAERWLRPADQLDCLIRRLVIPVPLEISRSPAPTPLLRGSLPLKHPRGGGRAAPKQRTVERSSSSNRSGTSVQSTFLSGPCLRSSLTCSNNLSNEKR